MTPWNFEVGEFMRCEFDLLPQHYIPEKGEVLVGQQIARTYLNRRCRIVERLDDDKHDYLVEFDCGTRLLFGEGWLSRISPLEQLASVAE